MLLERAFLVASYEGMACHILMQPATDTYMHAVPIFRFEMVVENAFVSGVLASGGNKIMVAAERIRETWKLKSLEGASKKIVDSPTTVNGT